MSRGARGAAMKLTCRPPPRPFSPAPLATAPDLQPGNSMLVRFPPMTLTATFCIHRGTGTCTSSAADGRSPLQSTAAAALEHRRNLEEEHELRARPQSASWLLSDSSRLEVVSRLEQGLEHISERHSVHGMLVDRAPGQKSFPAGKIRKERVSRIFSCELFDENAITQLFLPVMQSLAGKPTLTLEVQFKTHAATSCPKLMTLLDQTNRTCPIHVGCCGPFRMRGADRSPDCRFDGHH